MSTRRLVSLSHDQRAAVFGSVLAVAALACTWTLHAFPTVNTSPHVTWWMLAIGFALADGVFDIHLDVNRDTYTISLMEIPLVIGLFLANPLAVVGARVVGAGLALAFYRRQPLLKLYFNVSLLALEAAAAVALFRLLGGASDFGLRSWGPTFTAVVAANVISTLGVMAVIALHGGRVATHGRQLVVSIIVVPLAGTCLALAAVTLLHGDPPSALLLVAIVAAIVVAYRAYAALSQRYSNLQRLYEFTGAVQGLETTDDPVPPILDAARAVMRAGVAELVLVGDSSESPTMITQVGDIHSLTTKEVALQDLDLLTRRVYDSAKSVCARATDSDAEARRALASRGLTDVLIAPLVHKGVRAGTMSVAGREGDVASFDRNDLRLFETLVNHASVALERSRLIERLEHEALHDALTGLGNRVQFDALARQAMEQRRPNDKLAVMLMDLDRFKEINDTLGHHHGDRLLQEVGNRLTLDLGEGWSVARLGGDEFAVLVRGLSDVEDARRAAVRVRNMVSTPFPVGDLALDVGASIGVALCPDDGEDVATLLQRADVAMYEAKADDGIATYARERDHYSPRRLALVGQLREAIAEETLQVHYQPKADLESGRVVGAEALLRWVLPSGPVTPDEFIPIAEHTGLIRPLTRFVLRQAIIQCGAWKARGLDLCVSINLSVRDLMDPDLTGYMADLLGRHGVDPDCLTLEITESSIMSDPLRTLGVLEGLRQIGLRLSIDDFGTGYSSLTYLKRLPVNEVKIDKSFVVDMTHDDNDFAIVRSVTDLAGHLGLTVTAEGVEDEATWDALNRLGCALAQGYYLSRPLPALDFEEWYQNRLEPLQKVTSLLQVSRLGA
jgi:diguanylate cyclase (GGDEF)-like protein